MVGSCLPTIVDLRLLYSSRKPETASMTRSLSDTGDPMAARASEYSLARFRYASTVSSPFISILKSCVLRVYSRDEECGAYARSREIQSS